MNSKKFYAAVTVEESGKYISYVLPFTSQDNVICCLNIKNIVSANVYDTRKRAEEICEYWNECYKKNGTLL